MSDTFGRHFTFTSIGRSHDPEMRGIIRGLPSGLLIDFDRVYTELKKRSPANYPGATTRVEEDDILWLGGIRNNYTTGEPIEFVIRNKNIQSKDYQELEGVFRPSHADYTYYKKYGDKGSAGMGRASGRETVLRVVAGSLARQYLKTIGVSILAFTKEIGGIEASFDDGKTHYNFLEKSIINCPDERAEQKILALIEKTSREGDSLGGIIECIVKDYPAGIGNPLFNKLHAELAKAAMSIPSVKGFELGEGFKATKMKGSEYNDVILVVENNKIKTITNHDGGIQGGISNGNDIVFRVAFKPISSIRKSQRTVDVKGRGREIIIKGRHDICIVPRACIIVESMAAMVLADSILGSEQ